MPSTAKIDLDELVDAICARNDLPHTRGFHPNLKLTNTYTTFEVRKYFDCSTEEINDWWGTWKNLRQQHFERFKYVPLEIERFLLHKTLKEHFGEKWIKSGNLCES